MNITDKKITILGVKRSGLALVKLVVQFKGKAKISHTESFDAITAEDRRWLEQNQVEIENNCHSINFIEDSDYVVLSPGVPFGSQAVQWARDRDIPVLGEIEFAYQFCNKPVIGVTGSNGKTTVVTLISEILNKAGYRPLLCGNVGLPFSDHCLDADQYDFVVLEISSFQLESLMDKEERQRLQEPIKGFNPFIGIILNFSQNHLDRHKDLDEYFWAKSRLFMNQHRDDHAVLNFADERMRNLANQLKSSIHYFNKDNKPGDAIPLNPNYLAIKKVVQILNIDEEIFNQVIFSFQGVEHRLEKVRTLGGVDYINDSKATTAEAGRWALTQLDQPVLMICGGRDKNIDFSVLHPLVRQKVKKMFVFGEAKEKLKNTFDGVIGVQECDVLETAVKLANEQATEGDCVLLSPMCASFDMFQDYEERGKKYKYIVNGL